MIELGGEGLREYNKIKLVQTTTNDLCMFEEIINFVFSYITFQHIARYTLITKYIAEAWRALKPGGYFRFQTLRVKSPINMIKNRPRILLDRRSDCFAGYSWRIVS